MKDKNPINRQQKRRVLLLDNQPLFRKGLSDILEGAGNFQICGGSGSYRAGMKLAGETAAELVVADICSQVTSGLDFVRDLRAAYPQLKILVLTMLDEKIYAERALKAGANGYVMKTEEEGSILDAVNAVMAGELYVSDLISSLILQKYVGGFENMDISPSEILTDRELDIFTLTGRGLTSREISHMFNISIKTVDNHKAGIKEKMGFRNSMELVQKAALWATAESDGQ